MIDDLLTKVVNRFISANIFCEKVAKSHIFDWSGLLVSGI
jgi:hypothetical protein